MNFIKRAFFSILHSMRGTLLTMLIFLMLAVLILSSFCILTQANLYMEEMRLKVYSSVKLTDDTEVHDIYYERNAISAKDIDSIAEAGCVKDVKLQVLSLAVTNDVIKNIETELQIEKYGENDWIRIEGVNSVFDVGEFESEDFTLFKGEDLGSTPNGAVISDDVAMRSHLKIGDSFPLEAYYTGEGEMLGDGEDVELLVSGIFEISGEPSHTDAPYYNLENVIYVLPEIAYTLNGNKAVMSAEFVIDDPLEITPFLENIQSSGYDDDAWKYLVNDTEYRNLRNTISSINRIMYLMLFATFFLGGIILIFMTMISLKLRDFEMGILLAVGENRIKIIGQLMVESLIPVLIAMAIAIFVTPPVAQRIVDFIGGMSGTQAALTGDSILMMYLCGIGLTLAASLVTVYKVMFYNPKKVLGEIG